MNLQARFEELKADIDTWARESEEVPDFWDELDTTNSLAAWIAHRDADRENIREEEIREGLRANAQFGVGA